MPELRLLLLASVMPALLSCAGGPQLVFGSEEEWPTTYAATGLRELRRGDLELVEYASLGWVDASACRRDGDATAISQADLERRVKRAAIERGANAIVDLSCRREPNAGCVEWAQCSGEAGSGIAKGVRFIFRNENKPDTLG